MRQKLFGIILLGLLLALAAAARADGLGHAEGFCRSLMSQNQGVSCMSVVLRSDYLDDSAVSVCTEMIYPGDSIKCLKAISDRAYRPSEITTCAGGPQAADRIQCFSLCGRAWQS